MSGERDGKWLCIYTKYYKWYVVYVSEAMRDYNYGKNGTTIIQNC